MVLWLHMDHEPYSATSDDLFNFSLVHLHIFVEEDLQVAVHVLPEGPHFPRIRSREGSPSSFLLFPTFLQP